MGWLRLRQVWLAAAAPGLAVGDIVAIFELKLCQRDPDSRCSRN